MAGETARVLKEMRTAIHNGEFLPGEQLRQEELAARFKVSRVPLREALLVLANQGLVSHRNNQGFRVTKRTSAELAQVYWMLKVFETQIYETLEWPDDEVLAELEELNGQMLEATQDPDPAAFVDLNSRFHVIIWNLCEQNLVVAETERIWSAAVPYLAQVYVSREARQESAGQHAAIIDALRARDRAQLHRAEIAHREASGMKSRFNIS